MELKTNHEYGDSELIMLLREENDEVKDYLYTKYSPLIHKELNRVKKRSFALGIDFADLSQEAMLAFSHAINNFNEETEVKFITFATLCIRRKLSNYINKFDTNKNKVLSNSISLDVQIDDADSYVDNIPAADITNPLNQIINDETLKDINYVIKNSLSENERMVLQYDVMGKSASEIAELLGMNTKQVYNLIHRARTKLRY